MPLDTLEEVREAQMVVEQHKTQIENVKKQIERGNKKIKQDIYKAAYIEAAIGAAKFIHNKFTKIKVSSQIK